MDLMLCVENYIKISVGAVILHILYVAMYIIRFWGELTDELACSLLRHVFAL